MKYNIKRTNGAQPGNRALSLTYFTTRRNKSDRYLKWFSWETRRNTQTHILYISREKFAYIQICVLYLFFLHHTNLIKYRFIIAIAIDEYT